MRLDSIAIGGTYQVNAPLGGECTVHVEAIDVHHVGNYQCLRQVLDTALVWVYECASGLRYPVSPQALRAVQG